MYNSHLKTRTQSFLLIPGFAVFAYLSLDPKKLGNKLIAPSALKKKEIRHPKYLKHILEY